MNSNHKWTIKLKHYENTAMRQENSWTSWNMGMYIDSDGEVAVYNRDSNQPDDLYYDSDASEEEPRKEKNQHTAFVATPKRRLKATLIGHSYSHEHADSQVTDIYNIDHLESVYIAAGMHEKFLVDKKEMMRRKIQDEKFESNKAFAALEDPKSDTSGSVNADSETEPEPESPTPQSTHLKKSVSKPQGYKRDPFIVPMSIPEFSRRLDGFFIPI